MKRKYEITKENAAEIREFRKGVKEKFLDRRLYAVQLLGEGMKTKEIAEKLNADRRQISKWAKEFFNGGINALNPKVGGIRRENMTFEQEKELLDTFKEKANSGQIIEVSEIKKAYEEKIGRKSKSNGHIYSILKRHGWRKIMLRSKHPQKANNEAIKASKKLNPK